MVSGEPSMLKVLLPSIFLADCETVAGSVSMIVVL
jgi:hypothetical protein